MRIPVAYLESMMKRYKKNKSESEEFCIADTTLSERLKIFMGCKKLSDPKLLSIISETIDRILEAATSLFKDEDSRLCIELLGQCDPLQIWDLSLQCCDVIMQCGNQKILDMIFSYEHLLTLVFHNPEHNLQKTHKLLSCLQFLIESMTTSKANKFKIEQFERIFLRFQYVNTFFQKSVYNLSVIDQQELYEFPLDNCTLKLTLPCDELNSYVRYVEQSNLRKIAQQQPMVVEVPFIPIKNPHEQCQQIANEYKIGKESMLYDQIYIRLLCHYSNDEQLLQKLFITNYVFHLKCGFNELQLVNSKYLQDITSRMVDQKDFLFLLIRMIVLNKDESLEDTLVDSLQYIKSKQIQLYEQNTFLEKLWLFELQGIQDTLIQWKFDLSVEEGNYYENRIKLNVKLQQLFFQQLMDQQFTQLFKKQPNYQQWNHLIVAIIRKSFQGEKLLPYYIINPLLSYCVNLIIELPINNQNQSLDYHLESNIIQGLIEVIKNKQIPQQLLIRTLQLLNQLVIYYKQEFDQVQIQNAQSEFMIPVPERYHKLLGEIWSNKILEDTLQYNLNEQLYTQLIALLATTMGENPARVRQFYENKSLKLLIDKIIELLKICSRASPLIVTVINLLIAISTNEDSIALTLQSNDEKQDNLIKRIFAKCYLPSVELLHDPTVSDDFAKKIIMLYSQSMMAKKQIEKVIENTFVTISQLVDLSKDKIEEIVSNQEKLQSFYSYSKSLQALLQLFMQLQPERKSSYRSFQGYEELQMEEAQRQKDLLFNSLLKNNKFVEALEKIIMSPILIGSKNKDTYVETYVNVLCKKNKLNPYQALCKELDLISQNYMVIGDQKVIDIGKLVDYEALQVHMSDKYFFRKIIKHISPQTYRGFYILSRFHLIHYLIKMCINLGTLQGPDIHLMIAQLLEIYFLSSQHAGFHESIMMFMAAKQQLNKNQPHYDEESQIRRRISKDNLIPLQSSCLDLITKMQQIATSEQREFIIRKYAEIIQLFFQNIQERHESLTKQQGIQIISTVTYLQDMVKSCRSLINQLLNLESQFQPIYFTQLSHTNRDFFLNLIRMLQHLDHIQRNSNSREHDVVKKILPGFIDAIYSHVDTIIKQFIFRKITIEKITIIQQIVDPAQLELVCNEYLVAQAHLIYEMINILLYNSCEGILKNLLEQLISKLYSVKDIQLSEIRRFANEQKEQPIQNKDIVQLLQGTEARVELRKSLFDKPEIKSMIESICEMGFTQAQVKKAIQRIEIPEPTMIISMLVDGRISDDEEEQEDFFDQAMESQETQILNQLSQEIKKQAEQQQEQQQQQQQQQKQQDVVIDKEQFQAILSKTFPQQNSQLSVQERINTIIVEFQNKLDQSLNEQLDKQLNNQRQNNHLLEYLFTIAKKQQPINKILDFIFSLLSKPYSDVSIAMYNYTKVFQWMNLLQSIAQPEHEKIYQHVALIDQEPPKELKYHLSFQKMLTIGFALSEQIQNQFIAQFNQEREQLKAVTFSEEQTYTAVFQQVQNITNNLSVLFDSKQTTLKLFCKELQEIQKYLFKFVQNQQNKHDQLVERYWDQIEIYLQFMMQICQINLNLQEQTQQVSNQLCDWDENLIQKLQIERDQAQNIVYFRQLIQRRFFLDKSIIIQLLQCLNNFGIHRQHKLFEYLTKKQQSKSLLEILLQLKAISSHMEYEESQPVYLENLIYLIGIDQKTSSDLVLQLLRQIMLNEHIDYQAQQLKGVDELTQVQIPSKYIETPLQYLLANHPILINNPVVYNAIIEQNGLSITDRYTEISRLHVKPPPPAKPSKDPKEAKEQQQQNEIVLRYEIGSFEYSLNKNFLDIVDFIIQSTVDRFFEENSKVLEQIFNVKYTNFKDDNKIYLYGWDQLLRILEMLILQIPQLILHIRQIKVKLPLNEEITFIQFLVKYLTWIGGEKLTNFMHNYLSDINLMSYAYGITLGQEVLQLFLRELNLEQQNVRKFYHILQLIILFTQTLTLQNCSLILSDQKSQFNIIPQLVQTLNQVKQCENKQFIKIYHQTITRILEPFLQSQIYYTHLQQGKLGDIFRLQQEAQDPFVYHYLHCLKNQLVCYLLYPSFKSTAGSAQHFVSHQQQQLTLKDEYQQEIVWPLYQSRKNYNNQRQSNQKQQEEDLSDSDSDQEILDNNVPRYRYANAWGSDCYYDNGDFISKYGRDEERNQRENQQNLFPQCGLNILFCSLNQEKPTFTLPVLTVTENVKYQVKDHKQWITSIVGLFYSTNEYFENKKQLISKAYENSLKFSVEYIQQINRLLLQSTHRNRNQDLHQDYQQYYLNGALNFLQPYSSISCFYSKFGSAPNQQQQDYLASAIAININDSQLQLQRILSQITININQSRVVINGMPNDLQDQNLMRAKLQSLLHSEELSPETPTIIQIQKRQEILPHEQELAVTDELILEIFVNLLLDQQNFPQFPFSILRQVCKCQRVGNKMLSLLLDLFKENKNNLDFTLKILYLVSQKIPAHNLRDLLSEQLLVSPKLNRREKANLDKVIKQVVIEEEENVDEQQDDGENSLVFLINQINSYCEKNIAFMKYFHNPESYIPLEKNILLTPLLQNQTGMHLSYLIQIIRGSLTITNDDNKDKNKKYDDDYNSKFMRRQATVLSQNNIDENKLFDFITHFKPDDLNFHQMLLRNFPDKFLDHSEKQDFLFSFSSKEHPNPFKPVQPPLFQQPSQNILPIQPPEPNPVPPIPSISILQQQQQQLQHYQQLRQQHQQQQNQQMQQQQLQSEQYNQQIIQMQFNQKKIQLLQQQQQQIYELQANEEQMRQQQQQQLKKQDDEKLKQQQNQDNQDEPEIKIQRKVSAKISHMEIDIITALCTCLSNPLLRDGNSNELVNILNTYANDKLKIEHSIKQLTHSIIQQAKVFNIEMDKKRKQLREITNQREKDPAFDPEIKHQLTFEESEIIKELNSKTIEPNVIQRCFNAIIGFMNQQFTNEQQVKQTSKPSSTQTRAQIQQDKKKHKLLQQGKPVQDEQDVDAPTKKEIKTKFINVLQTKQTHNLWLNVVETLLLIFNYSGHRSIEYLQKKLNPLLECFIKLYQNVHEESYQNESQNGEPNFFERNLSGSATNSLQFGLLQFQNVHLQRSFSAVRNENEMQMKIDELFTYLCIKGKRVINYLISQKLQQITIDIKQSQSQNPIKLFKENDPLGFVFFKMNNIVSFENKKHFFELDLEGLRATEKPSQRGRGRASEMIEITIVRETRLQQSLEKVLNIDKNKFRRCEIKVRYQGERGQDEGGIRKEWMTNLVKDILQTDKFELNPKRFYKIIPNKKATEDLNHFKLLGKIMAKSIYDGLLLPVYFIAPIYKLILQKNPTFDDLEHYNEGYYDTFLKFLNDETQVQYKDLFEFWIPEEYASLIEQHKKQIFSDILQEYLEKNPIEMKQELKPEEQAEKKVDPDNQLEVPLLQQDSQQESSPEKTQQVQALNLAEQVQKIEEKAEENLEKQQPDEKKQKKPQNEEINKEDLENREKKRLVRKNKKKQLSDEALKQIKIQDVLSKITTFVSVKHKRLICELISKKIMIEEIKPQIQNLRDGFFDILSKEFFSYMEWRDLQKLIIGVPSVDVDDLQSNTEYVNYDKNNQTVLWFWEVLKTLSDSEKADFLMFSTGSPLVPFGGFKNLRGHNGPRKFSISKDFNQDHFIKAHACFNRIDLPEYNSKEMLREKLLKSLKESGSGFDLS